MAGEPVVLQKARNELSAPVDGLIVELIEVADYHFSFVGHMRPGRGHSSLELGFVSRSLLIGTESTCKGERKRSEYGRIKKPIIELTFPAASNRLNSFHWKRERLPKQRFLLAVILDVLEDGTLRVRKRRYRLLSRR
jgi:hypothetical protein